MTSNYDEIGTLPAGWVKTELKNFTEIVSGQSPPSSTYNSDKIGLPFYQGKTEFGEIYPTPVKWCDSPNKIAEREDVLISVRAPVGSTNICPEKACIGRGLAAIRGQENIKSRFILYLLRAHQEAITAKSTGTTFDSISGEVLKQLCLPVPPLAEQKRILEKIEELFTKLDAGIDALKKMRKQLRRYRQAVLRDAVTGELTKEWREEHQNELEPAKELLKRILTERRDRWEKEQLKKFTESGKTPKNDDWKKKYKEPVTTNGKNLSALSKIWTWASFDQLTIGAINGLSKRASKVGQPAIVLRLSDINKGEISLKQTREIKLSESEISKYKINDQDLLCVRVNGSVQLVGRLIRNRTNSIVTCCDHFIKVEIAHSLILKDYLWLFFKTEQVRKFIELNMVSSAGQNTISQTTMNSISVALPPLSEQGKIIEEVERLLSVADKMEATIAQSLKQAERLRQSILKRAFEGKLVEQDATDEPAEILLDRIKEERELMAKELKSAGTKVKAKKAGKRG